MTMHEWVLIRYALRFPKNTESSPFLQQDSKFHNSEKFSPNLILPTVYSMLTNEIVDGPRFVEETSTLSCRAR